MGELIVKNFEVGLYILEEVKVLNNVELIEN